ncbi:hypothetical protein ACFYPN_06570 [Streptomyces sp. NPDC005576]|uniref:hypothetical protein n=1 Tax=Streptomyces sp. NPDC005576 TaxID=3364726 RepID=UPI0036CEA2CD
MPLIPEESQIHESAQGPLAVPASGRTASTPRPVPGPRSAATPRPGHPGPARPAPPAQRPRPASGPLARAENRSVPQLQVIPAPSAGALDAAEEAVDLLLDNGRAPGDVLVFTTGEQHPWATHELSFGEASYWAQHEAGDDVFFADLSMVGRATGRPVVVVAVNGEVTGDAAQQLSVARERAGTLLIVCGDPQAINAALGTSV